MYLLTFFITQNLIRVIPSGREHCTQKESISEIFQHLQFGNYSALSLLRFKLCHICWQEILYIRP